MAAKLTKDDWLSLQQKWEESDKPGFDWLVQDAGGISRQAISKYAKNHGWCKKSEQPKVAQKVAQPEVMPKKQDNPVKKQKHKRVAQPVIESCATEIDEVAQPGQQPKYQGHNGSDYGIGFDNRGRRIRISAAAINGLSVPGRPASYHPDLNILAYRLALVGLDNEEIAGAFGLNVATLTSEWFRDYPGFYAAIKEGRIHADANIGSALYDRAMGYFAPEIKVFVIDGEIVEHEVMKHYPPDYKALQFWLTNRQAERWKNKVEVEKKQEYPVIPQEELDAIYARNLEKQKEAMAKVMGRAARLGIANYVDSTAVEIDE